MDGRTDRVKDQENKQEKDGVVSFTTIPFRGGEHYTDKLGKLMDPFNRQFKLSVKLN
jgi:hypothetical protein